MINDLLLEVKSINLFTLHSKNNREKYNTNLQIILALTMMNFHGISNTVSQIWLAAINKNKKCIGRKVHSRKSWHPFCERWRQTLKTKVVRNVSNPQNNSYQKWNPTNDLVLTVQSRPWEKWPSSLTTTIL